MNGIGLAVGSAALIAGGLGIYLVLGPMREPPGLRGASEPSAAGAWEQPEDSDSAHADQNRARRPASPPRASAGAEKAISQPGNSKDTGSPVRPFPVAREIPVGMERAELFRRYGDPAMRTTSVEHGVPLETLVYLRREPEAATFILLRAGRVAAASTSGD